MSAARGGGRLAEASVEDADASLFAEQRRLIDACFDTHIPADRPAAILQFPFDGNVGNHMMWVAIVEYLAARGVRVAYVAHGYNFSVEEMTRAIGANGTVLFTGGVTLSRLWPRHAQVKRMVAAACPTNRLISLPSTMLFIDDQDRREAGEVFGDHGDVVLMARDPVSAASAREVFPDRVSVVTIHDSTFRLAAQPRASAPECDIIWLARDDKESIGASPLGDVRVFDWPDLDRLASVYMFASRAFSKLRRWGVAHPLCDAAIAQLYRMVSLHVLERGNAMLDAGRVLVTDRMHPHVLAALRGQPSVLLPDRFGKNRAVYEYSSSGYSTVHWADEPRHALEMAKALAAGVV